MSDTENLMEINKTFRFHDVINWQRYIDMNSSKDYQKIES